MNSQLLQQILECERIPTLPAIAMRVVELTGDQDVSMRDLSETIQNDQGLASKILRTVNSAFYAQVTPCSTISRAQLVLGLQAVKTLALGFTLVSSLKDSENGQFDYIDYWRRCVFSGVGAKATAAKMRCAEPEEAFLGGLLQDIGMLAMYQALGDEYLEVVKKCEGDHSNLVREELQAFELQHPSVGEMLGERWKLPASLLAPIRYHERPTAAPREHLDVVRCVGIGNLAAYTLSAKEPAPWLSKYYKACESWFAISPGDADDLLSTIVEGSREAAKLFELEIGEMPDIIELLESANSRLGSMVLQSERELESVVRENEDLQRALHTDSLTGLPSRRNFLETMAVFFSRAHKFRETLHLALLDVDLFRRINDEHGRENGDLAIKAIAQRIQQCVSNRECTLARFCGEEFSLLMGGIDRTSAGQIIDTCRRDLEARPLEFITSNGVSVTIPLTLSCGLVTLEPSTMASFDKLDNFINAAEQAVRAAKTSGGNTIRLFSPRKQAA
ncbi:MAG: sensor domain-containing diguanylate cyclase [Planctomycetota bacterium]|jgi:diguanylate cyclase (GGDEF)-like protein